MGGMGMGMGMGPMGMMPGGMGMQPVSLPTFAQRNANNTRVRICLASGLVLVALVVHSVL
jgi:hypothetical protein